MRSQLCVGTMLAVLIGCAAPGHAGIFGPKNEPPPQWGIDAAKTPTPAYAKDDESVILLDDYLETVDAQGRAVERERIATRILKPQGRNNTCDVSYDVGEKINYFRVWTIATDEKRYQAQDTDFQDYGEVGVPIMLSTRKHRVARAPALDPGAVEICESEELLEPFTQETDLDVQDNVGVVSKVLELDLPPGRAHTESWHNFNAVKAVEVAPNHWRWEVKDVPGLNLRDIPSHPAWYALASRMSVQWGDAAVEGKDNEWRALGQWYTALEADRSNPSPEITAKAQALEVGAPDFYSKLGRITEFIQKDIRYFVVERGIGGWQSHPATDIYRNGYGDCKDKATLTISMLQVAGIHAFYVLVDDRRGIVDPEYPSMYGNHMISAIEIPADVQDARLKAVVKAKDGKRYLIFDPTNERTPVGNLPSYEQGSYGILAAGASSQVIALPVLNPDANGTDQKGAFTLAADGTLSGAVDSSHIGPEGGDLRMFLKYTDDRERNKYWETQVSESIPGVTLDSFKFVEPEALDKPLEFHYKLTAKQYARSAGGLMMVRPRVLGSVAVPFNDKPRTVPIDLEATGHWHDSYDITLPDGYAVDELPDPVNVDMDFASYHSTFSTKDKVLHYERDYTVKQVELAANRAQEFRHFEGVVSSDEKATVVLKKQ